MSNTENFTKVAYNELYQYLVNQLEEICAT